MDASSPFDWSFYKDTVDQHCASGNYALALESLATWARDQIAETNKASDNGLPEIDGACKSFAEHLQEVQTPADVTNIGFGRPANIYLVTEIYQAGGHRQLLEMMIRSRPNERHLVLFSGLLEQNRHYSLSRMAEIGIAAFYPDRRLCLFDRLLWLHGKLSSYAARRVFLLHHPADVIAAVASYAAAPEYGSRYYFVRHADTVATTCATMEGVTHLAIRPEQKQRILSRQPTSRVLTLPLSYDPGEPSDTSSDPTVSGDREFCLSGSFLTATCGGDHKFDKDGPLAFPTVITGLLQSTRGRHIHIGNVSQALIEATNRALKSARLSEKRIRFVNEVSSVADCLRDEQVDLFVSSFPVGGGLSMSEAAYAGVPVAVFDPLGESRAGTTDVDDAFAGYIAGTTHRPPEAIIWSTPSELYATVRGGLDDELLHKLSDNSRTWYLSKLTPGKFRRRFLAIIAAAEGRLREPLNQNRVEIVKAAFDGSHYLDAYPDVAKAGIDPLRHYLNYGEAEHRRPHALFDPVFYLSSVPESERASARKRPFTHYLARGESMGLPPHPLFDPAFCRRSLRQQNIVPRDLGNRRETVFELYLQHSQNAAPHPLFDPIFYRSALPFSEVREPLLVHFLLHGASSGINPHPLIDLSRLADKKSGNLKAFLNYVQKATPSEKEPQPHPLFNPAHFASGNAKSRASIAPNLLWSHLIEGNNAELSPHPLISVDWVERSRPGTLSDTATILMLIVSGRYQGDTHPLVSANHIREQAPWIARTGTHPVLYFLTQGLVHNIDPHPWFSLQYYVRNHPDSLASSGNPLVHFIRKGQAEGHNPHPFFDATAYARTQSSAKATKAPLLDYIERGAAAAVPAGDLGQEYRRFYHRSAVEFMRAAQSSSAVSMFRESLHRGDAPQHPTLMVECRRFASELVPPERVEEFHEDKDAAAAADEDDAVNHLYPATLVRVNRPNVVSTHHIAPKSGHYWASEGAAGRWHNATVIGGSDGFLTSEGIWLDPTLAGCSPPDDGIREHGCVAAVNSGEVLLHYHEGRDAFEAGILATGCYSRNYFHFLLESLPRIQAADSLAPAGVPILADTDLPAQFYQALRLLYPSRPIIRISRNISCSVRNLYVGTMQNLSRDELKFDNIQPDRTRYSPQAVRWLNRFGAKARSEKNPKRIYFRRKSNSRQLLNGAEIEAELESLGFAIVDCAFQGFYEQIRLAASADVIVGQNGADLANIVFARPGTEVYALCSDAAGANYYVWSTLGGILGLKVTNVVGWHAFGSAGGSGPAVQDDFTLPLRLLSPFLELDLTKGSETGMVENTTTDLSDPVRIFDGLFAGVDKAHVITSAWGMTAGWTPRAFDAKLVTLRRAAASSLLKADSDDLRNILQKPFYKQNGVNVRSGFVTLSDYDSDEEDVLSRLEQALQMARKAGDAGGDSSAEDVARSFMLADEVPEDGVRRFLGLAMLYRQAFRLPVFFDLATVPDDIRDSYLKWLVAMPYLFREGEDQAYLDYVPDLLDFLHRQLMADHPEQIVNSVARIASHLDLGQLFLIEGSLKTVWPHRNRLLETLALRDDLPAAQQVPTTVSAGNKLRVGVLVRTFAKGPDSEAIVAFFRGFDRTRYELIAYSIGFRDRVVTEDEKFSKLMESVFDRQVSLVDDKVRIRAQLLHDKLDLFILANATTYGIQELDLALYHRLAPRQIVLNSHVPMPTGFPSFDAYVTGLSDDPACEVDQDNYSERLIRVKGPVINYLTAKKIRDHGPLARQSLGLEEDDVVLMNGGSMQKLRHDCLKTMMRSVKHIPRGKLMIAPYNPGWISRSQAFAFNRQLVEMAQQVELDLDKIVILGELSVAEAEGALMISDIYLNPFPHGGATMTHLALLQGVPPITMRRKSTRSIDQFLVESFGFPELLASDADEYVALATQLGTDPDRRRAVSMALLAAADNPVFVDNIDYSRQMQGVVDEIMGAVNSG